MQDDARSDVVHCPSCDEDVPETLYCLNCGYPLYKIEKETVEETIEEPIQVDEPEEIVAEEEGVTIMVEDEVPETREPELEVEVEVQPIIEENEIEPDEEPITIEPVEELEEAPLQEAESGEITLSEPMIHEEENEVVETVDMKPIFSPDELTSDFAPDPMTRDVMENLGKNITLKIRLVKLLEMEQVKEDTFKKLYDSYVEQGKIWVMRREETIRRFKTDREGMQKKLETAQEEFELLEIRRSIGDTSDEEYSIKAPAYKWDMEHLDKEIKNRNAGLTYLDNLRKLVPEEEVESLQKMVETDFSSLRGVENVSNEILEQIIGTLKEALDMLE